VSPLKLGLLSVVFAFHAAADGGSVEARARFFNETLQAPAGDWWNRPVQRKLPGVRNIKTVLPGVLYRGGGPGGKVPISESGLRKLCEAGFEKTYYLYPTGFNGPRTVNCTGPDGIPNRMEYVRSGFVENSDKLRILEEVRRRVLNPEAGPVFVHCWNGYHASGEIAAVAYVQFCGFTVKEAQAYWMKNQTSAPMNTRIAKYVETVSLRITSDLQSVLCPR
jgi:hypothetical protein